MNYRMVARTNEKDYIEIVKANGVCSSSVGRVGGKQTLKLAAGCLYDIGTPFHEFMHAIGKENIFLCNERQLHCINNNK